MKLHAFYALLLLALIAVPGSVVAQDSTLGEIDDPPAAAAAPEAEDVPVGEEPARVEYENPIPEFLRGRELPLVIAGRKIVTVPVSATNWVGLDRGDLVRVDFIRKDIKAEGADGTTLTAEELTLRLVDEAEVYAISNFAPANTLAPVCLTMSSDEAHKCLEAMAGDGQFVLTVVLKQPPVVVSDEAVRRSRLDPTLVDSPYSDEDWKVADSPYPAADWPVGQSQLDLVVGGSFAVTHDSRIKTVDGFDSSIISVKSIDPDEIRVTAPNAGRTTITFVDEQSVRNLVDVVVLDENAELKQILRRLYPEAAIEVIAIKDSILLRGTVDDGSQVEEIMEIAECFAPQVLNQLRTNTGRSPESETSSRQIPPGMRVVTVRLGGEAQQLLPFVRPSDQVDVLVMYHRRLKRDIAGRGMTDVLEQLTRTLVTPHEVFDDPKPGSVSLLVPPGTVSALKLAESKGLVYLRYREPKDAEKSGFGIVDEEFLKELTGLPDAPDPWLDDGPKQPSTAEAPGESVEALRSDLRALHEDVRQLIEILQQRSDEPEEEPVEGAAALQTGVLFFQADWCGPCQKMWPIVARQVEEGLPFKSVDIERDQELRARYRITSTPAFVFLKDGEEVHRHVGLLTDEQLSELSRLHLSERRVSGSIFDSIEKALGLHFVPLGENPSELKGGTYRGGLKIFSVVPGSPTDEAGLRRGDVLVGLDRWETIEPDDVTFVISRLDLKHRAPLKFYVVRDGETLFGHLELEATAQERVPPAACPTEPVLETQPQ